MLALTLLKLLLGVFVLLPRLLHHPAPQVKQLEVIHVGRMSSWKSRVALLCICSYCNSWLLRRDGAEPGKNPMSGSLLSHICMYIYTLYIQYVSLIKLYRCSSWNAWRCYTSVLLHMTFSVYFWSFTFYHYRIFFPSEFITLCVSAMQTQLCVCTCTMFIDFNGLQWCHLKREKKP